MPRDASEFELKLPLPRRGSAVALRDQLIDYFIDRRPEVGERFFSDHELVRLSRLSRPTVRRALDQLHQEGWIERRHGRGTFVGPRAALVRGGMPTRNNQTQRLTRLAVLVHQLGDFAHDWYTPGVLGGIDQAAGELGITLELLGDRDGDVKNLSRRLMQSRPDVLACTAPAPRHAMLMAEAQRLDIPVIGTGTLLGDLGVPCVCEDGVAGAAAAIQHLVKLGHRRIGFVQMMFSLPWVFQRREGYIAGLREVGIEPDENLVLWLAPGDQREQTHRLEQYLHRQRPTAVLFGCFAALRALAPLVAGGKLRVPRDLSVVHFDQHASCAAWLGGVNPTTLALPLAAMGRQLAEMARDIAQKKPVAAATHLPCLLVPGESVAAV